MPEEVARSGAETQSSYEVIAQGVKDHAGFSETTPLTQVRETVFQQFQQLQGRAPQEMGARLISTFDTLKLVAEETQERGQNQNTQSLNNFAGVIRDELARIGYPPELFTEERVIGRLSQLTPDKLRDRARLLGVPEPTSIQEAINLLYTDIAQRTFPQSAPQTEQPAPVENSTSGADYYQQFPILETPVGNETAASVLQSYDNILEEAVQTNQISQGEDGIIPSAQVQQRLQEITARIQEADLPLEVRQRLLGDLSINNGLNRIWHRTERYIILNDSNYFNVLYLAPNALDGVTNVAERRNIIRSAYATRMRIFHPDLLTDEVPPGDFWKIYRGKDTDQIARKLNNARDALLQPPS